MAPLRSTLLGAVALLLAACGGGGGDAADVRATTPGSPTPGPAATAPPVSPDSDAQATSFADLARQGLDADARITYAVSTGAGETQQLTFSSQGERSAILFPGGRMISTSGGSVIACSEHGQVQCVEMPAQGTGGKDVVGAMAAPFVSLATALDQGLHAVPDFASLGERQIAGRTADCASFEPTQAMTGDQQVEEATLCVDPDSGLILLYEATGPQGTWRMEATEIGEPRADDFEPPAPPRQMGPTGPGSPTAPPSPY